MDSATAPHFWGRWNRLIYRLHWRLSTLWPRWSSRRFWRWAKAHLPRRATYDRPLLYLTWGRIGDMVLGTAVSRHLQRLFGRPVVMIGREEIEELVKDHVDCFLPFSPEAWQRDERYRRQFLAALWDDYDLLIADIHLFNGGSTYFRELIDLLPIKRKFVYEGYADPKALAPSRPWPETAILIRSLKKSSFNEDPQGIHVWHDMMYYFHEILQVCGVGEDLGFDEARPVVPVDAADPDLFKRLGIEEGGYVAVQPLANNVKKNYPIQSWQKVFAAFPDQQFVVLGADKDMAESLKLGLPNVLSLCGKTSLTESIQVVRGARMFVGIDSSMAHVATCLGKPTVVVAHSTNLGYFFPYPAELGFDNVQVIRNVDYDECSGCFTACTREPIWKTYRQGALCLRTLPAQQVIDALARHLELGETADGASEPADTATTTAG